MQEPIPVRSTDRYIPVDKSIVMRHSSTRESLVQNTPPEINKTSVI